MRTRLETLQGARNQFRALFKQMAVTPGAWNLYQLPGDCQPLMNEHATFDVQPESILVRNVHAMAEQTFINALSAELDRRQWRHLD